MPTSAAICSRRGAMVSGEQERGQSQVLELGDGLGTGGLDGVRDDEHALRRSVPEDDDGRSLREPPPPPWRR